MRRTEGSFPQGVVAIALKATPKTLQDQCLLYNTRLLLRGNGCEISSTREVVHELEELAKSEDSYAQFLLARYRKI